MEPYVIEGGMGRVIIVTTSTRAATGWARRRYGSVNDPYRTRKATTEEMQDHLRGGAVFFAHDGSVLDKIKAYAMAGLEPPKGRAAPKEATPNAQA